MAVTLDTEISTLMSNKRRAGSLKKLGIITLLDALTYYPFRVTAPVPVTSISQIKVGTKAAFVAHVQSIRSTPMRGGRGNRIEIIVEDADDIETLSELGTLQPSSARPGIAALTFFSYKKYYVNYIFSRVQRGAQIVVAGDASVFNNTIQFTHPNFLTIKDGSGLGDVETVEEAVHRLTEPQPIYYASAGIKTERIHESILGFIKNLANLTSDEDVRDDTGTCIPGVMETLSAAIPDIIPEEVRAKNALLHRAEAFLAIHAPVSHDIFYEGIRTLRFEEAFVSQVSLLRQRVESQKATAYVCSSDSGSDQNKAGLVNRFINSLPFALTAGQKSVVEEIRSDMARTYPMSRLLQGEVGSGKTVIALISLLQAVESGYQAVLVAPTQVLAEQHYQTISQMVADFDVPVILLEGGMRLEQKRKALAVPASGEPCIVIATHMAFSRTFQAPNLALVVIDEQHRFGVQQRAALSKNAKIAPHMLVMTATPIPRSAAMTWFGNLDISMLTELPGGRKPITSVVVDESDSATMVQVFLHARKRIEAGERVYVVCPRIDEDSAADADTDNFIANTLIQYDDEGLVIDVEAKRPPKHSVLQMAQRLSKLPQFEGIEIATLTSKDTPETKREVMEKFSDGTTPVLVATTVIEVGVDVPQASCIIIFDADVFGLAQLHQLRGRVGRGGTRSWAFFINNDAGSPLAAQRLDVIRQSNDGAKLAEADMEIRGVGDVLGDAQSGGQSSFKLLRVVQDADLISTARQDAQDLLTTDPPLTKSEHIQLAGAVLDFSLGTEEYLMSN